MITRCLSIALGAATVLGVADSACAATVERSFFLTNQVPAFDSDIDGAAVPRTISNQIVGAPGNFDTSLGTLTGVRIEYDFVTFLTFFVGDRDNTTAPLASGTGTAAAQMKLVGTGGTQALSLDVSQTKTLTCTEFRFCEEVFTIPVAPPASDSFTAAEWAALTGTDSYTLQVDYQVTAEVTEGSDNSFFQSVVRFGEDADRSAQVFVYYDYDPIAEDTPTAVPLPAGLPLMLAGLAGLAALSKKSGRGRLT